MALNNKFENLKHCQTMSCKGASLKSSPRTRRGAIYLVVVMMAMIIGMMAMAAIHVAGLTLEESTGNSNRYMAKLLAVSAIENGLAAVQSDPSWRTNFDSGFVYPASRVPLNGGNFSWKLIDEDGSLSDDLTDTVLLQGFGYYGDNTHAEEVRLQPTETGLTCLASSLTCNGDITNGLLVNTSTDQIISSNGKIEASKLFGTINGDAWAVGEISGTVSGTKYSNQSPPREMPGESVFDYYIHMGTHIAISSLPFYMDTYHLEKIVLSPASNPYGAANGEGIYVIDCNGLRISVHDLRVEGTLVLLNLGSDSSIANEVSFKPAVSNFPSLLVNGRITVLTRPGDLSETNVGVNFNPIGSPYEGVEDADLDDTYPGKIEGLVYISGKMNFFIDGQTSNFKGSVVCGEIDSNSNFNLEYDDIYLLNPPPGFASGSVMRVIPGSWDRVASPQD